MPGRANRGAGEVLGAQQRLWGIPKGPWLCELIAGVSWMEDFASNRVLHAAYE